MERVLIVEDNPDVRTYLTNNWRDLAIGVIEAERWIGGVEQ
ncbi:MAG: hypothetical protein R3B93_21895 [Bacteroidia bacterium]